MGGMIGGERNGKKRGIEKRKRIGKQKDEEEVENES